MNKIKINFASWLLGLTAVSLSGCYPAIAAQTRNPGAEILSASLALSTPISSRSYTAAALPPNTTAVTIYQADSQCRALIPQAVVVPANNPIEAAVGKVLAQRDSADFDLAGYRVNVKDGIATVDLRIAPDSKRQFTSLSTCELMALFGSLRKTLTNNPSWQIKDVRFTVQGKELYL